MLWHFAAKYAPQGDIGRYSDRRIEGALDWFGRGKQLGKLIEALVVAGWIDRDAEHRLRRRHGTTVTCALGSES